MKKIPPILIGAYPTTDEGFFLSKKGEGMAIVGLNDFSEDPVFSKKMSFFNNPSSLEGMASKVFLGIAGFFTASFIDRSLKNYFLPEGLEIETFSAKKGFIYFKIEEAFYSLVLRIRSDFFSSSDLNRILSFSRFCVSFLLGARAARSLDLHLNLFAKEFYIPELSGFCWAVFREVILQSLPKRLSFSLLLMGDGVVSSLVQASPKEGVCLNPREWYYKALSRGIFQIIAASTTFSGSSVPSFVQNALSNFSSFL